MLRYGRCPAFTAVARMIVVFETEIGSVYFVLDAVGSPHLKMILDPANLFLPGTARPENVRGTLRHAVDLFGDDIVLAHGKDIRAGAGIDFCATGEGIIAYPYLAALLAEIGFTGDMMLHGIYDVRKFAKARQLWEACRIVR